MSIPRPRSIDDYWSEVERGLAAAAQRSPSSTNQTPEQLRKACHERRAFFFKIPDGFFILQVHANPTRVHIEAGHHAGRGGLKHYMPQIEALARDIGACQLTFHSTRPGYRRVLRDWARDGNFYVRVL